jgi:phospholipid/cholesterol/gamma-HCH transport system substrate-binding protein
LLGKGKLAVLRSLSRWQAVILGTVVAGSLALGSFGVFAIGNRHWLWSDTFQIQVGFRQIRGVEAGTRVRVQGMEAGEVIAVQPPGSPGQDVVLRLRLAGRFRPLVRADASAQIVGESMVGGKVVEIDPGSPSAKPVEEDAIIASRPTAELADVVGRVEGVLAEVRDGKGTLGKLLKEDKAHEELVQMLEQGRTTLASIQQDADAVKALPIIRSYVKDAHKLLVRPECEVNRQWFGEAELFEPGRSVLTAQGRQQLDRLVPWLEGLKHKGSEVVVAAYTDPSVEPKWALTLSQKQSEAVCAYLKDQHSVHKMGWLSKRPVTPIGLGVGPAPPPEKEKLPAPRVEVLVFVPQG